MNCVVFFATLGRTLNGCNRLPAASVDCVNATGVTNYTRSISTVPVQSIPSV